MTRTAASSPPARAAAICGKGTCSCAGFTGSLAGWIGVVDARSGSAWPQDAYAYAFSGVRRRLLTADSDSPP